MQAMNKELNRLASYDKWPSSSSAWPSRLARCGFHATGVGETAVCFDCGLLLSQWQFGDDPKQRHRAGAPHCSIVIGHNSTNVPLVPLRDDFDSSINTGTSGQNLGVTGNSDVEDSCSDASANESVGIYTVARAALNRAKRKGVLDTERPAPAVDPENPDFELLRREAARHATFTDFPTNSPMTPAALAKAGFFYKGPQDRVQCAFCQLLLRNWVPEDDAMTEHRKHRADCPFVTNAAHHGNVCMEDDDSSLYTATQRTYHTTDSPSTLQGSRVSICFMMFFCVAVYICGSVMNFYCLQCFDTVGWALGRKFDL